MKYSRIFKKLEERLKYVIVNFSQRVIRASGIQENLSEGAKPEPTNRGVALTHKAMSTA